MLIGTLRSAVVHRALQALLTPLTGAGFGAVVVVLNHAEATPWRALSLVTGGGAGWAAFAILMAAWWRRRLVLAVAAAALALMAAVTAYYLADAVAADSPLPHDLDDMRFWGVGALVVGPPLGLVGWRARLDGTWVGLLAMLVAPVGFAAESALYLEGGGVLSVLERSARVTVVAVALAVAVMLVGATVRGRGRGRLRSAGRATGTGR